MVETKNQVTDGELVLKLAGYNSDAFEQLFGRYSSFLYALIKKILGDPELSERVLLNVFSVFWKRIDYFDTTTNNVFTYLTLLTRNRAVDVLKRMDENKLAPVYDENYELERIIPKLSPVMKPVSLERALAFAERLRFFKTQLTEVQNLILNMVFYEGLTDEEIAKKLNVPEITIKQKIQTALGTLMQNISGKKEAFSGNNKVSELIKLEAIGRLSQDEKEYLANMKADDPEFPWALLGEYQNLVALLASVVVPENPPSDLSREIKSLFGNVLIGKTDLYDVKIPNKIFREPILESNKTEGTEEAKKEDFPIRFKDPSKQDLEIIEETTQIASEPENSKAEPVVEKESSPIDKKPGLVPVSDRLSREIKSTPKSDNIAAKTENKEVFVPQDKTITQANPEIPNNASVKNVVDPVSINKKLNQLLSKTEEIKEKNKLIEERKIKEESPVNKNSEPLIKTEEKLKEQKPVIQKEKPKIQDLNKVLDKAEKKSPVYNDTDKYEKPAEVISKAKEPKEEQQIEKLIEDYKHNYEQEIGTLQKKLKRNVMITVGLIVLLLGGVAAIFLNMQQPSSNLITKVEKPIVNEPLVQNTSTEFDNNQMPENTVTQPTVTTTNDQKTKPEQKNLAVENTLKNEEKNNKSPQNGEQKTIYPPLPEEPKILESVTNDKTQKDSEDIKKGTDVAVTKAEENTEKPIPPKEEKTVTEEPAFFVAVEEPPQPVGGLAGIQQKISYPLAAKKLGIEGKVLIQAIIDENGNVAKAKVIKGIGSGCDEAALNAVKSSKFTPGKQRGKNVRVQITIPIVFKL